MMKRKLMAIGSEHLVYRSEDRPDYVIKVPHYINQLSSRLLRYGFEDVRRDIERAYEKTEQSRVRIPETRLLRLRGKYTYCLWQRYIRSDRSIADLEGYLAGDGSSFMQERYISNPLNFLCHDNEVYWVDITLGPDMLLRILRKIDSPHLDLYMSSKARLKRFGW